MVGMTSRRFLIFLREPRQWFMIISPFIIVFSMTILMEVVVLVLYKVAKGKQKTFIETLVTLFFPFFVLYGFCLSSGIYMIVLLTDREAKMRHWMYLQGLGSWAYYGGTWIADVFLFFVTEVIFVCLILLMGLKAFSTQIGAFFLLMTSFGAVLVPMTYFFQHFFSKP